MIAWLFGVEGLNLEKLPGSHDMMSLICQPRIQHATELGWTEPIVVPFNYAKPRSSLIQPCILFISQSI